MDDIKRVLLGDHEAAKRLTDAGVLVPCPWCNRTPEVEYDVLKPFEWVVICPLCGVYPGCCDTEAQARLAWNTRAPILSAEEVERLEATNEHDAQRVRG